MKQLNIEQLNKVFDKNFKYLEKEIGTPDYEDLKLFMRSEMEEILDEMIGEEKIESGFYDERGQAYNQKVKELQEYKKKFLTNNYE